jgi:uncharacterized SAM-binding protein YcdF (DUF218 family)
MIRGRDIICISSIDWDFVWQGHQEIMSAFAKNGNRVLYIENTGIRSPRLSDMGRLKRRVRNWRRGLRGIRQESENLFICSPLILPFPYSRLARLVNRTLLINDLKAWIRAVGFRKPVIWTFLPTSVSVDIIDNIDNSLVVYYCIAEFSELAGSVKKLDRMERKLLERCDVVFAQGERIKQRCGRYNKNVHIFPFGVKSDLFSKPQGSNHPQPEDMRDIKRPVFGYIGGVHKHVDFALLKDLAAKNPDSSLVLVGPVQSEEASTLKDMKNVFFLGQKKHAELPAYIDLFDLCLIPYLITEYTKTVYPTKLNEYLMRGKRVLSTPLPEIVKFVETFGDVVSISRDKEDFVKKARALSETPADPELSKKLSSVAERNSWENRVEEMSAIMERELGGREGREAAGWRDNFARVTRVAKEKALAFVAVSVLAYALLFHTPLIWWVGRPLKVSTPPAAADAIVVLGGDVGESGRAGLGYGDRVKYAAELYKAGYARKVIFSSGWVYAFQEADVMRALAILSGIPPNDIMLEKKARNTYENVAYSLAIAENNRYNRLILVSSPYHMLRLKVTAEKAARGGNYRFILAPIPHSSFYGDERRVQFKHIKAIVYEYLALLYYKIKGYA